MFYIDLLLDRLFEQLSRVSVHAGRRVSIDRNHWILSGLWTDETCYDAGIDSSNGFKLIARVMLELIQWCFSVIIILSQTRWVIINRNILNRKINSSEFICHVMSQILWIGNIGLVCDTIRDITVFLKIALKYLNVYIQWYNLIIYSIII